MSTAASNLVNKVWNYCNLLRDDGVSYGDYVEQLTYLLFLKMDYERTRPPYNKKSSMPTDYNWASLIELDKAGPVVDGGHGRLLVIRRSGALVIHLKEEKVGELLDV